MAQDMRLARERMTESAPPDVHRAPPDFSPPPPRGESAPPPEAAQHGDDVGDVNTVAPADEVIPYPSSCITRGLDLDGVGRLPCPVLRPVPFHPFHVDASPVHSPHHCRYTNDGSEFTRHLGKLPHIHPPQRQLQQWETEEEEEQGTPLTRHPPITTPKP
ncbi:unnamed protein product [Closterium sp. NIES-54]